MHLYENLIELLADARSKDRHIRFIDGDKIESIVTFAELWDRALALLGTLQARGIKAGDELGAFKDIGEYKALEARAKSQATQLRTGKPQPTATEKLR